MLPDFLAPVLSFAARPALSAVNLIPKQTLRSLRENTAWAKERLTSAGSR